jgi:hypothetical protein
MKYFIVQDGLEEPIYIVGYQTAVEKFEEMITKEPHKRAGVFLLGSTSAMHWHHVK